ncbi:MAG: hypothetical protein WA817_11725 [Candidatus Acidiferrum sp.]
MTFSSHNADGVLFRLLRAQRVAQKKHALFAMEILVGLGIQLWETLGLEIEKLWRRI